MSSTARGGKRSEADFYPSPAWAVHRLIDFLLDSQVRGDFGDTFRVDHWLEPCAGDGAIIRAVNERVLNPTWTAVELREECRAQLAPLVGRLDVIIGDFLDSSIHTACRRTDYDICITNPPFSLALPIIRACLPLATHCFFLERLNFLGTADRHAFFRERMPDIYVIPDRVSFTADGKADSIEYAWFHWHPYATGRTRLLDITPLDVRRPKNKPKKGTHP